MTGSRQGHGCTNSGRAVAALPTERTCACASAAKYAVLTQADAIPASAKERVGLLFGKYFDW